LEIVMSRFLALVLLLLLSAGPLLAAPLVGDRSPLRPGLWWDPDYSGSGFDVHVAGPVVFVLWYTYRADGTPIWYAAQGEFDAQGLLVADWREHRLADGGASGQVVGQVRIERLNPDRLTLDWTLHGRTGIWSLQPLPVAAVQPEVDHSGAWYEPERSGYGFTVAEQGSWRVAAYYFYDGDGRPTWLLGHNAGQGATIDLLRYEGRCPGCGPRAAQARPAAQAVVDFDGETRLALDIDASADVPADFRRPRQPLQMLSAPVSARPADHQLARFDSAAALLAALRGMLEYAAPFRVTLPGPVVSPPPPSASPVSTTNLVEAGVDEADLLKSDGRFLYTFDANEQGRLLPVLRIAELVGPGTTLQLHEPVALSFDEDEFRLSRHGLYLHEDRLLAVAAVQPSFPFGPLLSPPPVDIWTGARVHLELFDRTAPKRPQSLWRASLDGQLISTRRIGDQLYVVHRSAQLPSGLQRSSDGAAIAHNRALLQATTLDELLPGIRIGADRQPLLSPDRVLLPPIGSRPPMPEFAIVTRINLRDPDDRESIAVLGGVETVYVAPEALYLATTRYQPSVLAGSLRWPGGASTEIHRVELTADGLRITGTGAVEGVVGRDPERAPFRFSEHEGVLRLLTVDTAGGPSRNRLSLLEASSVRSGLLNVIAQLPNARRPEPIGKPDEDLYGTRFVGDRLYAVTFLNVDPLYVIDLAPADPRILGELELPGFSEYLHPLEDGLLLGIGKDASPATGWGDGRFAWFQGLQIVLFDVADPSSPQVVQRLLLGERGSDSALLRDHHAFSVLPLAGGGVRFAIPARLHGQRYPAGSGTGSAPIPWTESGLFAFDIGGRGSAAQLQSLAPMITRRPPQSGWPDGATGNARSLLTPDGVVYVSGGRFYDAPWSATGTPRGPQ
jgi:hypothetical protein